MNVDWLSVLKVSGPFGLFCLILLVFIWKVLLPENRKANEKVIDILQKELDASRHTIEANSERFIATVDGSLKGMQTAVSDLGQTLKSVRSGNRN